MVFYITSRAVSVANDPPPSPISCDFVCAIISSLHPHLACPGPCHATIVPEANQTPTKPAPIPGITIYTTIHHAPSPPPPPRPHERHGARASPSLFLVSLHMTTQQNTSQPPTSKQPALPASPGLRMLSATDEAPEPVARVGAAGARMAIVLVGVWWGVFCL
jgi:hypothetical protein